MNKPSFRVLQGANLPSARFNAILSQANQLVASSGFSVPETLELVVDVDRLALRCPDFDKKALVSVSFVDGAANHRRLYGGGRSQQLSKAIGLDQRKDLMVVDATAGLASDSFVLASLGAQVQMLERNPILALMINDSLSVASSSDDVELTEIVSRMSLQREHSGLWLERQVDQSIDVIYLDPMFPERKKKAAVKKEMYILQRLLGEHGLLVDASVTDSESRVSRAEANILNSQNQDESDRVRLAEEADLLSVALDKVRYRVVVKRPRLAPQILGPNPSYSLSGKSIRFDVYARKKIS